jgi:hypothetical protein
MVAGRIRLAWERAPQTSPEFRELFAQLPVEKHSLSRASFFEPVYGFARGQLSAVNHAVVTE